MGISAILALLLPILLEGFKLALPTLIPNILSRIFNPPTALDIAKAKLPDNIATNDLMGLAQATDLAITASGQDKITPTQLNSLLSLVQ